MFYLLFITEKSIETESLIHIYMIYVLPKYYTNLFENCNNTLTQMLKKEKSNESNPIKSRSIVLQDATCFVIHLVMQKDLEYSLSSLLLLSE